MDLYVTTVLKKGDEMSSRKIKIEIGHNVYIIIDSKVEEATIIEKGKFFKVLLQDQKTIRLVNTVFKSRKKAEEKLNLDFSLNIENNSKANKIVNSKVCDSCGYKIDIIGKCGCK